MQLRDMEKDDKPNSAKVSKFMFSKGVIDLDLFRHHNVDNKDVELDKVKIFIRKANRELRIDGRQLFIRKSSGRN